MGIPIADSGVYRVESKHINNRGFVVMREMPLSRSPTGSVMDLVQF
jgi:hypothetical protein